MEGEIKTGDVPNNDNLQIGNDIKPKEESVEKEGEKNEAIKEGNNEIKKEEEQKSEETKGGEDKNVKKNIENKSKKEKKNQKINLILTLDEENSKCADCGNENPTKVSINNGVIICEDCALKHEELGHEISFVKGIDDDFDEYLLNFIVFGSNSKFKRFLAKENVDASLPIEKKYLTKALLFYRINLKKKVLSEELIKEKGYENPNELIEKGNIADKYPEFEHYKMKSKIIHDGSLKEKQNAKLNKLGGSLLSFGKKMYGGIKIGANYVAKKAEGPTNKIKKGAKFGAGFVGKRVSHAYESLKKNVIKTIKDKTKKVEGETNDGKDKNSPPAIPETDKNVGANDNPIQPGSEVKEENVKAEKEGNENEDKKEDSNEEKIDI